MIWTPRVTVAAIIEQDGRFLLVEEMDNGEPVFNQPAGHWERGESLPEAAIRETREETAYTFQPEALLGIYHWHHPGRDLTFLRVAFIGTMTDHDPAQALDHGILQTHWMDRSEIAALGERLRSPQVLRCVDDYLAGKRYGLDMLVSL